jgi:cytochrome c553
MTYARISSLLGATLLITAACSNPPPPPPQPAAPAAPAMSQVDRGKYLVTAGLCNDCHTPFKMGANGPEPDMSRMLSGHPESIKVTMPKIPAGWGFVGFPTNTAWAGPWGVSFTANLTPDQNTGLGVWDENKFMTALREGKHMGTSRPILPPMPWEFIGKYSDDDLKAIFAYLRTIPPVVNHVPDPIPPAGAPAAAKG